MQGRWEDNTKADPGYIWREDTEKSDLFQIRTQD